MTLTRQRSILRRLVFLLGALVPVLHATTILSGTLYFTTFQDQGAGLACNPATAPAPGCPNVWKVAFVYDSVAGLCLGTSSPVTTSTCPTGSSPTPIKTLSGADGILFDPNDPTNQTLLVGEQSANKVAQLKVDGTLLAERTADPKTTAGQAYSLTVTPDGKSLLTFPNDATSTEFDVDVLALSPSLATGSEHPTNLSTFVKTVAFVGNTAYWGNAKDGDYGFFGTIDLSTIGTPGSPFPIALSPIVDDVGATTTSPAGSQGMLPSHNLEFDAFSGCLMMSGKNQIWQVCPDPTTSGRFRIKAKIGIPNISGAGPFCTNPTGNPYCGFVNWDQTTVDGKGHLFAANNDGDVLFIDYSRSANKRIDDPANYKKLQFLQFTLDDIAVKALSPLPGRMTGGGSVFESDGTRVTHGFELHCDTEDVPNSLEINWGPGHHFHLTTLVSAFCFKDPAINAGHPTDTFNTYVGMGTGLFDGSPGASASWTFTDAGEPGTNDMATIVIKDSHGNVVLTVSGKLDKGNQQAHTDNK